MTEWHVLGVIFCSSSFETYVHQELPGDTCVVRTWIHCVCIDWNTDFSKHYKP